LIAAIKIIKAAQAVSGCLMSVDHKDGGVSHEIRISLYSDAGQE
jgi:hypothetical protein